jgi:hypothetical protein
MTEVDAWRMVRKHAPGVRDDGGTADDPRQHALQRRAVARRVVLAVPSPGDPERGPMARSRAGADVRAAHDGHPVREQPARLNGAGTAPWR